MSREKPSLPYGWVVKQSGSYPDRVYYFNKHSGVSTWEMPKLVPGTVPKPPSSAKEKTQAPLSKFSSNEDSDSSAGFSDTEKYDPKNEPIFSQFQKEICNTTSQFGDEIDIKQQKYPHTPHKEVPSSVGKAENDGEERKVPSKLNWSTEGREVQCMGHGVEFPKVKVKMEETGTAASSQSKDSSSCTGTEGSQQTEGRDVKVPQFGIAAMLSQIRKEAEEEQSDLRNALTSNIKNEEQKKTNKTSVAGDSNPGSSTAVAAGKTVTVRKVIRSSESEREKATPDRKQRLTPEKLSTPGGKGIWSRKRKISLETMREEVPSKVEKSSKPDLSLAICVGKTRKVIVSPKSAAVSRTPSSDSLDLTAQTPPLQPDKLFFSKPTVSSSTGTLGRVSGLQAPQKTKPGLLGRISSPPNVPEKKTSPQTSCGKNRTRRVTMGRDSDVRKVVSSDSQSDTNTNNSGLGDRLVTTKPLQADQLGRIQAWVDDINVNPVPPAKATHDRVPVQAFSERQQNEAEFCDMEVDEDRSEIEQMIIDLQEVRGELQFQHSQPVCDLSIPSSLIHQPPTSAQALYLVIDTSSFMNHLKSLSDIRDDDIEGYGLPILVIPWVVLQELDALKDNRSKQKFSLSSQNKANRAVKYINACFTGKHPRVVGQTPKEAIEVSKELKIECNDDRVLQCCLQYKTKFPSSHIVLLSEDVNLCTKARVSGVDASGVKSLSDVLTILPQETISPGLTSVTVPEIKQEKPVVSPTVSPPPRMHTTPIFSPAGQSTPTTKPPSSVKPTRSQLDRVFVRVKGEIKGSLGPALKTEMLAAYGDIWMSVVYRKPPWAALDIMESIKKHWIAVFGNILPRRLSVVVDSIVTKLQINRAKVLSTQEVLELVEDLLKLLVDLKQHSSYDGKVDKSVEVLQTIYSDLNNGNTSHAAVSPPSSSQGSSVLSKNNQKSTQSSSQKVTETISLIPQVTDKNSNKPQTVQTTKFKVQSSTVSSPSTSSAKSTPLSSPSASIELTNPKMRLKPASSSVASLKPGSTGTMETNAAEDFQIVLNCFNCLWNNILNLCLEMEDSLKKSVTKQYLSLLHRIEPLMKDLRFIFAMCLSISPYEIYNQRKNFDDLCHEMNTFFVRLEHKPVEFQPVTTDVLMAYFRSTEKRPSLRIGLGQLDDFITGLSDIKRGCQTAHT